MKEENRTSYPNPWLIVVETHNLCNSNCAFCPRKKMSRKLGFMESKDWKRVVSELQTISIPWIQFQPMGGEPLLDPQFPDRLCELKNKTGSKIRTHSNLFELHKFTDDQILQIMEIIDQFFVSIAPNQTVQKELFRTRHFDQFLVSLERLFRLYEKVEPSVDIRLLGRTLKECFDLDEKLEAIIEGFYQKPITWTDEYLDWGGDTDDLPRNTPVIRKNMHGMHISPCLYSFWPAIFWNMDVGSCACADYDAKLVLGNLKQKSLNQILHSNERISMIDSFNSGKMPTYCSKCTFYQPSKQ